MSESDVVMWRKIKDARPLIEEAGFRSSSSKGGVRLKFRNNYCMADGGAGMIRHAEPLCHKRKQVRINR